MRPVRILLPAAFFLARAILADPVTVTTHTIGSPASGNVTVVLRSQAHETIRKIADTDTPVSFDLKPGVWAVDIESADWWHQRRYFTVDGSVTIDVPLWRAGEVRGRVEMVRHSALPRELTARFIEMTSERKPLSGEASCPIAEDGRFGCRVPMLALDLRVKAKGYVTRFFWNRHVEPGKDLDLGTVLLQEGAAIVGRVEVAPNVPAALAKQLRVFAAPSTVSAVGAPNLPNIKLLTLPAIVETKGIFHIDAVPGGEYTITAVAGKFRSRSIRVGVRGTATSELHETLLVSPPRQLRVLITPALDPATKHWHVNLLRSPNAREEETVTSSSASSSGEFVADGLFPDRYRLEVGPYNGGRWRSEQVDVGDSDVTLPISISIRDVHGKVTLGGKPLNASVTLRSDSSPGVQFHSGDDGRFEGQLPTDESKTWTVKVESDVPMVRRLVTHVPIQDDGALIVDLPANVLTGVVVDSSGTPVDNAIVYVTRAGESQSTDTEKDGWFTIAGLSPDKYQVSAAAFLKESRAVPVEVSDQPAVEPLRLVLSDVQKVHVVVLSEFGPVAGAEVSLSPTDVAGGLAPIDVTDASGELWTTISPGAKELDVLVFPPGFSSRLFHTRVLGGTLTLHVEQNGGTVSVPESDGDLHPYLLHNGAISLAEGYLGVWNARVAGSQLVIPALDPGLYTLCMLRYSEVVSARAGAPPRKCRSGFLPQFGELTLEQ